ncbi:hypothetical protein CCP3SC15_5610002 [Gammaproteobacteria bacterium]
MDEEWMGKVEDAILQLADVFHDLCEKVDAIDAEIDRLGQSGVYDRLDAIEKDFGGMVGGFNDILGTRRQGRYKEMISGNQELMSYGPRYSKTFKSDIVGDVMNELMQYMDQEGASEEQLPAIFEQIISDLKSRFDEEQAEGTSLAEEASESPDMEAAEQGDGTMVSPTRTGTPPKAVEVQIKTGGNALDDLAKKARGYRNRPLA